MSIVSPSTRFLSLVAISLAAGLLSVIAGALLLMESASDWESIVERRAFSLSLHDESGTNNLEVDQSVSEGISRASGDGLRFGSYLLREQAIQAGEVRARVSMLFADSSYLDAVGLRPWLPQDLGPRQSLRREILLDGRLGDRLFPSVSPIGRTVSMGGLDFLVVGVLPRQFSTLHEQVPVAAVASAADLDEMVQTSLPEGFPVSVKLSRRLVASAPAAWGQGTTQAALDALQRTLREEGILSPSQSFRAEAHLLEEPDRWKSLWRTRVQLLFLMVVGFAFSCANLVMGQIVELSMRRGDIALRRLLGAPIRRLVIEQALKSSRPVMVSLVFALMVAYGLGGWLFDHSGWATYRWLGVVGACWLTVVLIIAAALVTSVSVWVVAGADRPLAGFRGSPLPRSLRVVLAGQLGLSGLAMMIALAAGTSMVSQHRQHMGYLPDASVSVVHLGYASDAPVLRFPGSSRSFIETVTNALSATGRERIEWTSWVPGGGNLAHPTMLEAESPDGGHGGVVPVAVVQASPGFVSLIGAVVLTGSDGALASDTALVSSSLAETIWGEAGAALGQTLRVRPAQGSGGGVAPMERRVVGVVGDILRPGEVSAKQVILQTPDFPGPDAYFLVSPGLSGADGRRVQATGQLDAAVEQLWKGARVESVQALSDYHSRLLKPGQLLGTSAMVAAFVALVIALSGVSTALRLWSSANAQKHAIQAALGAGPGALVSEVSGPLAVVSLSGVALTALSAWLLATVPQLSLVLPQRFGLEVFLASTAIVMALGALSLIPVRARLGQANLSGLLKAQ